MDKRTCAVPPTVPAKSSFATARDGDDVVELATVEVWWSFVIVKLMLKEFEDLTETNAKIAFPSRP